MNESPRFADDCEGVYLGRYGRYDLGYWERSGHVSFYARWSSEPSEYASGAVFVGCFPRGKSEDVDAITVAAQRAIASGLVSADYVPNGRETLGELIAKWEGGEQ